VSALLYFGRWLVFVVALRPLILRNCGLREAGLLPDEWYWADLMALRWGFTVTWRVRPS
jgi:hypothetical protein